MQAKQEPINIDWRLIPVGTKIQQGEDEYVVDQVFDGKKVLVSRMLFNEALKRPEKDEKFLYQAELGYFTIYNIPERLYPNDKKVAKTLLEAISEDSLKLETVTPLTSSELRASLTFQLYRRTSGLTVIQINDTTRIIPTSKFEAIFNPKSIKFLDGITMDIPNQLLYNAIKRIVLDQAI